MFTPPTPSNFPFYWLHQPSNSIAQGEESSLVLMNFRIQLTLILLSYSKNLLPFLSKKFSKLTLSINDIYKIKTNLKVDMRTAAYVHASKRIIDAIESKGTAEYFRK